MNTSTPFDYVPQIGTKTVLLLEDDRHFAAFLQEFLTRRGFTITHVLNGVEGVREVMHKEFDVIICDMMMPKLSGDMFYIAVERIKPQLCERFVFITGNGSDPKIHTFIKNVKGILLNKPFHANELIRSLERVEAKTYATHRSRD